MPGRYTGRGRARNGPARSRPPWLRPVDELCEAPPGDTFADCMARLQLELDRTEQTVLDMAARVLGEAARDIDEQALALTGRARPLPKRNPIMRNRHHEMLSEGVTDPGAWAVAFKATWSTGCSEAELADWFRLAQEAALHAAGVAPKGGDRPNRYVTPDQQRRLVITALGIDRGPWPMPQGLADEADRQTTAMFAAIESECAALLAAGFTPVIINHRDGRTEVLDTETARQLYGVDPPTADTDDGD